MHLLLFWKWRLVEPFHPLIPSLTNLSCPTPNTHPGNKDSFSGPQKTSEGGWMDPRVCFIKGGESQVGLGDTGQQLFLCPFLTCHGLRKEKRVCGHRNTVQIQGKGKRTVKATGNAVQLQAGKWLLRKLQKQVLPWHDRPSVQANSGSLTEDGWTDVPTTTLTRFEVKTH